MEVVFSDAQRMPAEFYTVYDSILYSTSGTDFAGRFQKLIVWRFLYFCP